MIYNFSDKQVSWIIKAVEERDREMEKRYNEDMIDHPFLGKLTMNQWLEWRKAMSEKAPTGKWKKEGF